MRHKTHVHKLREETLFFDTAEYEDDEMQLDDLDNEIEDQPTKSDAHSAEARRAIEDLLEEKRMHKELDYLEDFDFDEFDDLLGDNEE